MIIIIIITIIKHSVILPDSRYIATPQHHNHLGNG